MRKRKGPRGVSIGFAARRLLDIDGAANCLYRIFKGEVEGVAHGVNFLAAVTLAATADEVEVASLDFFKIGVVAFTVIAPERSVALGGALIRQHP